MLRILHLIPFLLLGFTVNVLAQEPVRTDTLPAAIKRASLLGRKTLSERVVIQKDLNVLASPTGDPDFVKFIQTLPGVATGSDGSSSYYVRGGNMGGNVQTLDGVTIYGSPHLVGLTTAYPADIVSVAEFQVGGFTSEEGNLSASHIKLSSRDGSFDTFSAKADISNFMLGGCVSTPLVKDRLSLMASFRVSPAPFEYKAISGMIDREAIDLSDAHAAIYDLYAKLKYRFDGKRSLSASFFHSRDNYKFRMNSGSEDMMSWDNAIGILQYEAPWFGKGRFRLTASYNHYGNSQGMEKQMNTTSNDLMIRSLLEEGMVHALVETPFGKDWHTQFGLKGRMAWFNPGSARVLETTGLFPKTSSPLVDNTRKNATGTLHGQVSKGSLDRNMFRVILCGPAVALVQHDNSYAGSVTNVYAVSLSCGSDQCLLFEGVAAEVSAKRSSKPPPPPPVHNSNVALRSPTLQVFPRLIRNLGGLAQDPAVFTSHFLHHRAGAVTHQTRDN